MSHFVSVSLLHHKEFYCINIHPQIYHVAEFVCNCTSLEAIFVFSWILFPKAWFPLAT